MLLLGRSGWPRIDTVKQGHEHATVVQKIPPGLRPRRADHIWVCVRSALRRVHEGNAKIHAYLPRLRALDGYRYLFFSRLEVYFCRFVALA